MKGADIRGRSTFLSYASENYKPLVRLRAGREGAKWARLVHARLHKCRKGVLFGMGDLKKAAGAVGNGTCRYVSFIQSLLPQGVLSQEWFALKTGRGEVR